MAGIPLLDATKDTPNMWCKIESGDKSIEEKNYIKLQKQKAKNLEKIFSRPI